MPKEFIKIFQNRSIIKTVIEVSLIKLIIFHF